jgi:hypothetical protein
VVCFDGQLAAFHIASEDRGEESRSWISGRSRHVSGIRCDALLQGFTLAG